MADSLLRGITLAKQFPSPAEQLRGLFVLEQVRATRQQVRWSVIAPVPYVPRFLSGLLDRPFVKGTDVVDSIEVMRPRYPVLPKRLLYSAVGRSMGLSARRSLRRIMRREHVDFVHAHALYPSAAAAALALGSARVPLIVTVHGSDLYTNVVKSSWKRQLELVVARAERIVTVSERLRQDLLAEFPIPDAKVVVIPDAYDDERFTLVQREARGGRPLRLLSVGNLRPVKGHDVLIRAFGRAVEQGTNLELTIVGSGDDEAFLRSLAATVPGSSRIRFAGSLGGDALVQEYAAADVFVLASRNEGFGVVYAEALATGLPVIATRCGGPQDIVTDRDGYLVPVDDVESLADTMIRVAQGTEDFDPLDISARAHERFCPSAVGLRLVELYRTTVMESM